jgi:hypothetical protein
MKILKSQKWVKYLVIAIIKSTTFHRSLKYEFLFKIKPLAIILRIASIMKITAKTYPIIVSALFYEVFPSLSL